MNLRNFLVVGFLLLGATSAWADKPIHNVVDEPIPINPDGSSRAMDNVRKAIIAGCQRRGWTAIIDGDAKVKCTILVRGKHYAEVAIPYSESSYSILYLTSRHLDYNEKKQKIHRNYNGWVIKLSKTINQQFNKT